MWPRTILPAAKAPSPLIRAARWVALISGFVYGRRKLKRYLAENDAYLQEQEPLRERMALKRSIESEIKHKQDMEDLYNQVILNMPPRAETE